MTAPPKPEGKHPPRLTISCTEGRNHDEPRVTGWHGWDGFPYVEHIEYLSKSESDALVKEAVAKAWEAAARVAEQLEMGDCTYSYNVAWAIREKAKQK